MNGIPRHSLWWFFIAQVAVIALHVPRLPWWLLGVWAVCAVWRIQVFRGQWSWPGRLAKSLIVFSVLVGILAWYRNPTSLESAAGTVIALFFLKMLECYQRRDVYLLIFVALFVAAMNFLFDQGLLTALWVFFSVFLVLVSLVSLHEPQGADATAAIKPVLSMLLQSIPLVLVLFLVFPRLAPIWSVPMPGSGSARTGMSDTMSPGDISQLGRSGELAFRVAFEGAMPPPELLYWRGMVLDDFDGRRWSSGYVGRYGRQQPDAAAAGASDRSAIRYEILLEPTGAQWLFALDDAYSDTDGVIRLSNGTLASQRVITSRFRYGVRSLPMPTDQTLSSLARNTYLRLPDGYNPQALAWAATMRASASSDRDYINRLLAYFKQEPFFYSLETTVLGRHSVDEFLFSVRRGFCEHYASSMAFVLRAAGVPARVVIGYLGAELNGDYALVHQYDAHAWVEAWVDGEWLLVDPSAAVPGERSEFQLGTTSRDARRFELDSTWSTWMHNNALLGQARLLFDRLDYQWQRWVLGYDAQRQSSTLVDLLGEVSPARVAALMIAVFALAVAGVLASLWGREWFHKRDPLSQAYLQFCAAMARLGVPPASGEAPGDYARRIAHERPEWGDRAAAIIRTYQSLAYRQTGLQQYHQGLRLLRAQVRKLIRESLVRGMIPDRKPRKQGSDDE